MSKPTNGCKPQLYRVVSGFKLECWGTGKGHHSLWVCIPKKYENEMLDAGAEKLHAVFIAWRDRCSPRCQRIGKAAAARIWELINDDDVMPYSRTKGKFEDDPLLRYVQDLGGDVTVFAEAK